MGDDVFAQDIFGDSQDDAEDFEEEFCCIVDMNHGLNGSTFDPEAQQDHSKSESAMNFDDFESFAAWDGSCGSDLAHTPDAVTMMSPSSVEERAAQAPCWRAGAGVEGRILTS